MKGILFQQEPIIFDEFSIFYDFSNIYTIKNKKKYFPFT